MLKIFDFGQSQRSGQSQWLGQWLRVLTCADVTLGLTWQDAIQGRRVWHVGARDGNDTGACERVTAMIGF